MFVPWDCFSEGFVNLSMELVKGWNLSHGVLKANT